MTTDKQIRQQDRKARAYKRKGVVSFPRVHKAAIPALWENPRYTGACRAKAGCNHCSGS